MWPDAGSCATSFAKLATSSCFGRKPGVCVDCVPGFYHAAGQYLFNQPCDPVSFDATGGITAFDKHCGGTPGVATSFSGSFSRGYITTSAVAIWTRVLSESWAN